MAVLELTDEVVIGNPEIFKVIKESFKTVNEMEPPSTGMHRYFVSGEGLPSDLTKVNVTVRRKKSSDWKTEYIVEHAI